MKAHLPKIRIMVVDDHMVARAGLSTIINVQPDMEVIAEAINGQEAVELYRKHKPDVILLDMNMPIMSGAEAAITLRAGYPDVRMIALTTFGGDEDIRRALAAGVRAYLTKEVMPDELVTAIRLVHQGHEYLPASISEKLAAQPGGHDLSDREIEVLRLIVRGYANKQIAYALGIAVPTAKHHVSHVLNKLGVEDRMQAMAAAIQRGIIHL